MDVATARIYLRLVHICVRFLENFLVPLLSFHHKGRQVSEYLLKESSRCYAFTPSTKNAKLSNFTSRSQGSIDGKEVYKKVLCECRVAFLAF